MKAAKKRRKSDKKGHASVEKVDGGVRLNANVNLPSITTRLGHAPERVSSDSEWNQSDDGNVILEEQDVVTWN